MPVKIQHTALSLLGIVALFITTSAQPRPNNIHLAFDHRTLNMVYTPFCAVEVLDNRVDTTKIYTVYDGNLSPNVVRFAQPAHVEIQEYIQKAISAIPHGSETLVINLQQLKIVNRSIFVHRGEMPGADKAYRLRRCVLFTAVAYLKKQDELYYSIVSIKFIRLKEMLPFP